MRIPVLFTCLAAAVLAALPLRPALAQDAPSGGEVTFNLFYDNLSDDGEWYNTPEYGYIWQPDIAYGQDSQWRPYTDGYWAQTDSGWTWVSYENFGWATYHYGRWTRLKDIGWAWVPGYEWGPGWVSWRTADDYVGWAPLPPKAERAVYEGRVGAPPRREREEVIDYNDVEAEDTGYTSNVDVDYDIGPENYCFVESRSFGAPVLSEVVLPPQRNVVIIERTTNVTNIYYDRRGRDDVFVYNSGPDYNFLSRRSERPIQRLQIEQRRDPGFLAQGLRAGGNPTQVRGGILQVAAPYFARRPTNFQQIKPARVRQTIAQPQVVHGWSNSGADPQTVERLRNRFREQAQQAPAKAIQPKEPLVQSLPAVQRVVTKSDLPVGPAKDMSAEAVDARRAERRQQRAAQGGNRPGQPGQTGAPAQGRQPAQAGQPGQPGQPGGQPKDNSPEAKAARRAERQAGRNGQPGQPGAVKPPGQPAQAGQPGATGPRPGALTEEERKARRDAALQQKAARDQTRGSNGQPSPEQAGQPGQATPPGQPKDSSPEAKAARRAQRQQERAAQPAAVPGQPEAANPPAQPAAQPKESSEEVKAARRAQRQQERAAQVPAQPQVQQPPAQEQDNAEKAARRAQRQQDRAAQQQQAQPQGQPQTQAQPQADPDKEARRAQRQQERAAQAQGQQRAQQQQERAAQQQQAQQQEHEARQAQRQQERAAQQQAQQQQAQQQGNQERAARQAQRQQEQTAQQQVQQQRAAQPQPQAQPQQGNPDKEARRAARQAERGKPGDNNPNQ